MNNMETEFLPDTSRGSTQNFYGRERHRPQFELTPSFLSPELTTEQAQAMTIIFDFTGLARLMTREAFETQRRCKLLAAMIFENRLALHAFSTESLICFASYIDAFPKTGFIWQKTLESEAAFVIPQQPLLEIDPKEFMQSFRRLFQNGWKLNCSGTLTLALFLLFFHRIMLTPQSVCVNWCEVFQTIIRQTCNIGW